jgi:regulator of sigma D
LSSTDELAKRARYMRNASPQTYLDFCAAFTDFTAKHFEILVNTTINLERAQGHAQMCKKILDVLEGVKHG